MPRLQSAAAFSIAHCNHMVATLSMVNKPFAQPHRTHVSFGRGRAFVWIGTVPQSSRGYDGKTWQGTPVVLRNRGSWSWVQSVGICCVSTWKKQPRGSGFVAWSVMVYNDDETRGL
jgi:hypothetical protein